MVAVKVRSQASYFLKSHRTTSTIQLEYPYLSSLGSTSMPYWLTRNTYSYYIYFLLALPVHNLGISLPQTHFSTSGLTSLDCYMSHIKNLKKYFAFLVQGNLDEKLYRNQNVMHGNAESQHTKFFYITLYPLIVCTSLLQNSQK